MDFEAETANKPQEEQIFKRYAQYLKLEKGFSPNTVDAYRTDLAKLLHFLKGEGKSVLEVTLDDLQQFSAGLHDIGIHPRSQARILSGIKSFYRFLVLADYLEADPSELLEGPKIGFKLPEVLTVEEIDAIIDAIDLSKPEGQRNRAMLETLYSCGLRVSELVSLRLGDLFFGEGYIRVVGKGDKQRLVPVSDTARDRIYAYLDCRKGARKSEEILFLSNRGRRLTRVMVFKIIRQAVLRAGIDKQVSPHTFRHSFATHLLEGGASIRQVQEMLGHENIVTTEIYTHLNNDHLRETVERYLPLR